jgi:hypothetical protein
MRRLNTSSKDVKTDFPKIVWIEHANTGKKKANELNELNEIRSRLKKRTLMTSRL